MEARVRAKNIPLRKVDIKQWGSPVAQQYGIERLPTLWLFQDGEIVSRESQEVFRQLM